MFAATAMLRLPAFSTMESSARHHHVGPHEIEPGARDGRHPAGPALDPYAERHPTRTQAFE
jgi:hypothetical protein